MLKNSWIIFGLLAGLIWLPAGVDAENLAPVAWEPEPGDAFVVDVPANMGYLVHRNGQSFSFPVATGKKAYVRYIGRGYRAETPIRSWTAEQKQVKGDRRTFGVSGRFIRLFRGGENSPYGIHAYYKEKDWLEAKERYFSMGCIIVTETMMDIIEKTYDLSKNSLAVITTDNLEVTLQKITHNIAVQNEENALAVVP